ncbi:MAG: hypothetical protein AB8B87_26555 [Granulosicoccus sp.]
MNKLLGTFRYCCLCFVALSSSIMFPEPVRAQELTQSGAVVVRQGNAVIQNLSIDTTSADTCAINIADANRVVVRNIDIKHVNVGICATNVNELIIQDVRLLSKEAPAAGPHCVNGVSECSSNTAQWGSPDEHIAIKLDKTPGAIVQRVQASLASTAVLVYRSPGTAINKLVCLDMRGPYPRGQCAIFINSNNSSLDNFYSKGYRDQSFHEDNVNLYFSDNVTVSNGLIDGNWSINGAGIIADIGSDNALVKNIDVVNTGQAAISVWSNDSSLIGKNFRAENIRVKDTHCEARYGQVASSGGLVFVAHPSAQNPAFVNSQFFNHCRSQKHYCMPGESCRNLPGGTVSIREENFTPRAPLTLTFPWNIRDTGMCFKKENASVSGVL